MNFKIFRLVAPILGIITISCVSFGQMKLFTLARSAEHKCVVGNADPRNQYNCCVLLAQALEFENENSIHLKSDPRLCLNPILKDLRFSLVPQVSSGIRVYYLTSPQIEQTPFRSKGGLKAQMWINLSPLFQFPILKSPTSHGFYPLLSGYIGVDEHRPASPSDRTFGGYYSSMEGWKRQYQKTLATTLETSACPPPIHKILCRYRVETIEEMWMNTITGTYTHKMVSKRYTSERPEN